MDTFIRESIGHVLRITINSQGKPTVLNRHVLEELDHLIGEIAKAPETRCVIFLGAGEKTFVAGADITEMQGFDGDMAREYSKFGNAVFRKIEQLPMPSIAAINGYALGGGCELALSCDIRIASSNAVFAFPEVSLGITPGFGGTQRLARTVGYARAVEMIATAEKISASEALKFGLVNEVVEGAELSNRVMAIATAISENGPLAVRAAKKSIQKGLYADIDTGIKIESGIFGEIFKTSDCKEGLTSYVEKRKRNFKNC